MCVNHALLGFISVSVFSQHKSKCVLSKLFYWLNWEFLASRKFLFLDSKIFFWYFFSLSFLRTYYDICFFHILCIIFTHIPKMNSVSISFNINNRNIIKTHSFLHYIMTTIAKIWFILKTNIFKIAIVTNITLFWCSRFLTSIPSEISILSYPILFYNSCKVSSKKTCRYTLPPSSRTDMIIMVIAWNFSGLFNDKSSSELSLIFM